MKRLYNLFDTEWFIRLMSGASRACRHLPLNSLRHSIAERSTKLTASQSSVLNIGEGGEALHA